MKALVRDRYGDPGVLRLEEIERPPLEDDRVLVRVHASSVNKADWYQLRRPARRRAADDRAASSSRRSRQVGTDFAGIVEAVGKDVVGFAPGDEVFGGRDGAYAEYVVARTLARKPANVTFEAAAAVPIAGLTALQALRDYGALHPGERGPRERRFRRRRNDGRPDREGARWPCDRRVQHAQRRARPRARSRPRARLHAGGLHSHRRPLRRRHRCRRQPLVARAASGARSARAGRRRRRSGQHPGPRATWAHRRDQARVARKGARSSSRSSTMPTCRRSPTCSRVAN